MPRPLPARVHLPSSRIVRLSDAAARAADRSARDPAGGLCAAELALLSAPGVLAAQDGGPLDPRSLSLRDVHTLRALLFRADLLDEIPAEFACENCGEAFRVAPSRLLEVGPFVDGELTDPELDAPFPFDEAYPVPPIDCGEPDRRRMARSIRLADRTVAEVLPLWRAAARSELRITPSIVTAMGISALGAERRASALARALASASEVAWGAVVDLWHRAHYPDRLVAVHRCAACGARNDLDVPLERELSRTGPDAASDAIADERGRSAPLSRKRGRRGQGATFPDLDAFEASVRAAAARIYRARGVRNVDLFIDAGVPACDDGGEPLLGCYTPGGQDGDLGVAHAPEIRIFYRTFQSEFRADPSFDVRAEIDETIDHELTHHLNHIAGDDPLDDDEHAEIARDEARRVGRREGARRAAAGVGAELVGFVRSTWPVWVLACGATALAWCSA